MQLRYAAWYVASFAPAAFIPWICGSDDSMTLLVKSMEFIVMAPTRAVSARTWSPMIGEAVPALTASGASSLQTAKSAAVGISPSAARVAASETRRIRARALTTLYCIAMSYSFQIIASAGAILAEDRKSTRLNSSHDQISYAVFCLKKKKHQKSKPESSVYYIYAL